MILPSLFENILISFPEARLISFLIHVSNNNYLYKVPCSVTSHKYMFIKVLPAVCACSCLPVQVPVEVQDPGQWQTPAYLVLTIWVDVFLALIHLKMNYC